MTQDEDDVPQWLILVALMIVTAISAAAAGLRAPEAAEQHAARARQLDTFARWAEKELNSPAFTSSSGGRHDLDLQDERLGEFLKWYGQIDGADAPRTITNPKSIHVIKAESEARSTLEGLEGTALGREAESHAVEGRT